MFFGEEVLQEVKSRVDLVEFIGEYVTLKPSGKNFRGLCPFHEEKTPSFMVSPEKEIFHCFGCGVGGNLFTFVMKIENLTFPEAVRFLADKVGMDLPTRSSEGISPKARQREKLFKLNQALGRFYAACLKTSSEESAKLARRYLLEKRKLKASTIEQFALGFSPPSGRETIDFLLGEGFSGQDIRQVGVGILTAGGELIDRFRGRIIFPLHDIQGRIIGFAGRLLAGEGPKYLNVSDSPLFSKGENLYGLFQAKRLIQKEGKVLLVEGYMDFLTLFEEGIGYCVASMGTALTREQARLLRRYTDWVILGYDADSAGQAATLRGIQILLEQGLRVSILPLPAKYDPDSFLREKGKEQFLQLLTQDISFFDFHTELLIKKYGSNSLESKIKIIRELLPFLQSLNDPLEQGLRINHLAKLVKVDEALIYRPLREGGVSNRILKDMTSSAGNVNEPGNVKAEKMLLRTLIEHPHQRERVLREIDENCFLIGEHRRLYRAIVHFWQEGNFSASRLVNVFAEDQIMSTLIGEILAREDFVACAEPEVVAGLVQSVKKAVYDREIEKQRRLCLSRPEDKEELKKLSELLKQREELKKLNIK
ncbi:MAG: primase [Candidatus Atribacteria bacterium]|nr:primase [Candidatus Atribacteria bacterium]